MSMSMFQRLRPFSYLNSWNKFGIGCSLHKRLVNMSNTARQITWTVDPNPALIDDRVQITVNGLQPNKDVTLSIEFETDSKVWTSHAHYTADSNGHLDLNKAASVGGKYKGVEPCGLLWSAYVPGDSISRFHLRDLETPHESTVYVSEGHLGETELKDAIPLSKTILQRQYKAKGVKRIPVREGRIRGTLFIPEGIASQKFPAVIDLYGTMGGLLETRAALLASRGFVTLALAYFGFDDLPGDFEHIELEYFEEAVEWLGKHKKVLSPNIGVIGISKGAEIALLMSTISEKVRAVVSINSFSYNSTIQHSFRGFPVRCVILDMEYMRYRGDKPRVDLCYENVPDKGDFYIPVEASNTAEFLLIHGGDDCLVAPSNGSRIAQRLIDHDKGNFSLHVYQDAGHIFSPPYTPLCDAVYHKIFKSNVCFGGRNPLHAHAQEDAWKKVLAFFNRTLLPSGKL